MLNEKFIKEKCKERGWPEAELARAMGMSRQYLSVILHYQKSCSLKTLGKMADVFECKLDDLWIREG